MNISVLPPVRSLALATLVALTACQYAHVHLEVLGAAAAVATMNHHLRWIDTAGTAGEWNSARTAVFRQIDGRWKIVYSHESVPPTKPT